MVREQQWHLKLIPTRVSRRVFRFKSVHDKNTREFKTLSNQHVPPFALSHTISTTDKSGV